MTTNKHEGCVRGFHHYRAAWYGKTANMGRDVVDEINIGMYHPEGGTTGEFSVKWEMPAGEVVARLSVYGDAWSALGLFGDVLTAMSALSPHSITPESFCDLLVKCGVKDFTDRKAPGSDENSCLVVADGAAPDLLATLVLIRRMAESGEHGIADIAQAAIDKATKP